MKYLPLLMFTAVMVVGSIFHFTDWMRRERRLKKLMQEIKGVPGKASLIHENWCPFPKTATCLCGKEPAYSIERRKDRGELK